MVNNWHQQHAPKLLSAKAGKKPLFCDSEVLTLAVARHWIGLPQEREFLRSIRSNHLLLFPRLVDQSQFNRRVRALCRLTRVLCRHLIAGIDLTPCHSSTAPRFMCATCDGSAQGICFGPKLLWATVWPEGNLLWLPPTGSHNARWRAACLTFRFDRPSYSDQASYPICLWYSGRRWPC